ncbi:TetR/AcrR family transcriptional regulator [Candidatus Binatia bacterium]|nr:TetR/AcrR family transcriptional regulator [Candidatus Binatia bacterium]
MVPKARRTRLPAEEREKQILQAATRVFARLGYRRAGTAAIASEAGISEAMIYKRFASKKDLFERVLRRLGTRVLENWSADDAERPAAAPARRPAGAAARTRETTRGGRLERLARTYLQGVHDHHDALAVQFQALAESEDPHLAFALRENHRAYVDFLAGAVAAEQAQGRVRENVDPLAAGWILNGIGFTLTLVRLLGLERTADGRLVSDLMVTAALDWLTTPAGPAAAPPPKPEQRRSSRVKARNPR